MILYDGWINARPDQLGELKILGVIGMMRYNKRLKCFEYCTCTEAVIERLIEVFPGFWPGSFTGYDNKTDIQLPPEKQKYWIEGGKDIYWAETGIKKE